MTDITHSHAFDAVAAPPRQDRWLDALFALALASLFTSFQINLNVFFEDVYIKFSPTIPLIVVVSVLTLLGFARRAPLFPAISWLLLALAAIHVSSAFRLGTLNGFREAVQVGVTVPFAFAFGVRYSRVPIRNFFLWFAPLAIIIMGYTIIWHILEGWYWGWKRLGTPKAMFDILPLLVAGYIWGTKRTSLTIALMLLVAAGIIIFFSGERKAYIAFAIAILLMLNPKNFATYLLPMILCLIVYAGVELSGSLYLKDQVRSVLAAIGIGEMPNTASTIERAWNFNLAMLLFDTNPIFGVGTNGYTQISRTVYSAIGYANVGLHGEFLRILVENGLVGLSVYIAWLVSIAIRTLGLATVPGVDSRQFRTALLWVTGMFFYSSFEGINTLNMILQYSMAFAPMINFSDQERPLGLKSLSAALPVAS